jgi:acetolactate decarboxylase
MSLRLGVVGALSAWLAFAPGTSPTIDTFGNVRRLVERRDDAPKVAIAEVVRDPHAYALGALANLRGEITVVDGNIWLSYPPVAQDGLGQVVEVASTPERAAFLVAAHVAPAEWERVLLPDAVSSTRFDDTIERWAADHGLRGRPFPFRIDGRFQALTIATVDQRRMAQRGPATEEQLVRGSLHERVTGETGTLVGFYDPAGDSAFTHEGAHCHIHAVVPGKPATGHAEAFVLAPGAFLSLPSVGR